MTFWEVFYTVFVYLLAFIGYENLVWEGTQKIADKYENLGWVLWLVAGVAAPAAPAAMFVAIVHTFVDI